MKLNRLAVLTVVAVVAGACSAGGATQTATSAASSASAGSSGGASASAGASSSSAGGTVEVKLGVDLPLSGGEAPNGGPTLNGVKLAIQQIQVPGFHVTVDALDDAVNGVHNPEQGGKNMQAFIADSSVFAVVGPFNSNVAKVEIPISNQAGLVQCSPANTNVSLTKPEFGALDLRKANPSKIAYVRVATTDDVQGAAGADIAYNIAKARNAYIVDDTETYGKALADVFQTDFQKLGGKIVGHDGAGSNTTDYTGLLTKAQGGNPDYVYFGGVTATGGGLLRRQMVNAGMGNVPFGGGDGINDGSAATKSSFLNLAGSAGDVNTYSTVAAIHDIPNPTKFANDYKAAFGTEPGAYSASGYACAQIFLEALGKAGASWTREAIRSYTVDPSHKYSTVLGSISFDANGDTSQHIISYYKFDPSTKDWAFLKQRDFIAQPIGS